MAMAVVTRTRRCDQHADGVLLVKCEAMYPMLVPADPRINALYAGDAAKLCARCAGELRREAEADYLDRKQQGFPFNSYEARMDYALTMNQGCLMSLYIDNYTFTGGAHGGTLRTADTWDLDANRRLPLRAFFPGNPGFFQDIIRFIQAQIALAQSGGDSIYFDDAAQLVTQTIKRDSFFVSPDGVTIFFQQYDIAPYAAGMPDFTIPWGTLGATLPSCAQAQ